MLPVQPINPAMQETLRLRERVDRSAWPADASRAPARNLQPPAYQALLLDLQSGVGVVQEHLRTLLRHCDALLEEESVIRDQDRQREVLHLRVRLEGTSQQVDEAMMVLQRLSQNGLPTATP